MLVRRPRAAASHAGLRGPGLPGKRRPGSGSAGGRAAEGGTGRSRAAEAGPDAESRPYLGGARVYA